MACLSFRMPVVRLLVVQRSGRFRDYAEQHPGWIAHHLPGVSRPALARLAKIERVAEEVASGG